MSVSEGLYIQVPLRSWSVRSYGLHGVMSMSVMLKVTYEDGTEEEIKFENDIAEINLDSRSMNRSIKGSREIINIDLSPLSTCLNLNTLDLRNNKIRAIDLSPLSTCASLQKLTLYNNQLQSVDLSPLSDCYNLSVLDFAYNNLQTIDLTPISTCTSLMRIALYNNQRCEVDAFESVTFKKQFLKTTARTERF